TVSNTVLGLTIPLNVLNIQVQQVVVLLQQGLVGGAQEVIGGVVDVQPHLLLGAGLFADLVGNRLPSHGGVQELLIVLSGDSHIQSVVGAVLSIVLVHVLAKHVAGSILGADTGVHVHAVQGVADHAEGQVGLNVSVLADGAAVTVGDGL